MRDGIERDCLLGMVLGTLNKRKRYMDNIKNVIEREKIEVVVKRARNRGFWNSIVFNIK